MRNAIPGFRGALLLATTVCCPAADPADDVRITVHVYDYTNRERPAAMDSLRSAGLVLAKAGIAVTWEDCGGSISKGATTVCGAGTTDVTHFIVKLLPERMSTRITKGPKQFGLSVAGPQGGFPTQAYLHFDRIRNVAIAERMPWPSLLGVFIAHELGHLLLGSNSHFPIGIMRARWNSNDLKHALMGALTFTPGQAEQMQTEVRRRRNARDSR